MQTITDTIVHTTQLSYERYIENRRHELATDIAERIGYPIDHTVEYVMHNGMAYCVTDMKHRPFRDQTAQALREGDSKYSGVNRFEYVRLGLEHDEALMADAFGRGELNGNLLIKVSRVPDAVVDGTAQIRGYRRDLLRSFVRLYYMDGEYMKCRLISLDGNSREGFAAVGELINIDMQSGRGSEAVLADHSLMSITDINDEAVSQLVGEIRDLYDVSVLHTTGQQRYSGSRFVSRHNALEIVKQRHDLLDQHEQIVREVKSVYVNAETIEAKIEQSLQRVAAAVTAVENGNAVGSLSDASVAVTLQNGEFGRECATGESRTIGTPQEIGMNQAKSVRRSFEPGTCRVCLQEGRVGECDVCHGCEAADNRGENLNVIHAQALRRKAAEAALAYAAPDRIVAAAPDQTTKRESKIDAMYRKYGKNIRVISQLAIGTAYTIIQDDNGKEIERF